MLMRTLYIALLVLCFPRQNVFGIVVEFDFQDGDNIDWYVFDGVVNVPTPDLNLLIGNEYRFCLSKTMVNHPLAIAYPDGTIFDNPIYTSTTNVSTIYRNGECLVLDVPVDFPTPTELVYVDPKHSTKMMGRIFIDSPKNVTRRFDFQSADATGWVVDGERTPDLTMIAGNVYELCRSFTDLDWRLSVSAGFHYIATSNTPSLAIARSGDCLTLHIPGYFRNTTFRYFDQNVGSTSYIGNIFIVASRQTEKAGYSLANSGVPTLFALRRGPDSVYMDYCEIQLLSEKMEPLPLAVPEYSDDDLVLSIDGNLNQHHPSGSCFHSNHYNSNPSMLYMLADDADIDIDNFPLFVRMYARTDCCGSRMIGVSVNTWFYRYAVDDLPQFDKYDSILSETPTKIYDYKPFVSSRIELVKPGKNQQLAVRSFLPIAATNFNKQVVDLVALDTPLNHVSAQSYITLGRFISAFETSESITPVTVASQLEPPDWASPVFQLERDDYFLSKITNDPFVRMKYLTHERAKYIGVVAPLDTNAASIDGSYFVYRSGHMTSKTKEVYSVIRFDETIAEQIYYVPVHTDLFKDESEFMLFRLQLDSYYQLCELELYNYDGEMLAIKNNVYFYGNGIMDDADLVHSPSALIDGNLDTCFSHTVVNDVKSNIELIIAVHRSSFAEWNHVRMVSNKPLPARLQFELLENPVNAVTLSFEGKSFVYGYCNTPGKYCVHPSKSELDCLPGFYCIGSQTAPIPCEDGFYCPSNSVKPLKCLVGFKCTTSTTQECIQGEYCGGGLSSMVGELLNEIQLPCPSDSYCETPKHIMKCKGSAIDCPCSELNDGKHVVNELQWDKDTQFKVDFDVQFPTDTPNLVLLGVQNIKRSNENELKERIMVRIVDYRFILQVFLRSGNEVFELRSFLSSETTEQFHVQFIIDYQSGKIRFTVNTDERIVQLSKRDSGKLPRPSSFGKIGIGYLTDADQEIQSGYTISNLQTNFANFAQVFQTTAVVEAAQLNWRTVERSELSLQFSFSSALTARSNLIQIPDRIGDTMIDIGIEDGLIVFQFNEGSQVLYQHQPQFNGPIVDCEKNYIDSDSTALNPSGSPQACSDLCGESLFAIVRIGTTECHCLDTFTPSESNPPLNCLLPQFYKVFANFPRLNDLDRKYSMLVELDYLLNTVFLQVDGFKFEVDLNLVGIEIPPPVVWGSHITLNGDDVKGISIRNANVCTGYLGESERQCMPLEKCNQAAFCATSTCLDNTPERICPAGSVCSDTASQTQCPKGFYCPEGTRVVTPIMKCFNEDDCPEGSGATGCPPGYLCDDDGLQPPQCVALDKCSTAQVLCERVVPTTFTRFEIVGQELLMRCENVTEFEQVDEFIVSHFLLSSHLLEIWSVIKQDSYVDVSLQELTENELLYEIDQRMRVVSALLKLVAEQFINNESAEDYRKSMFEYHQFWSSQFDQLLSSHLLANDLSNYPYEYDANYVTPGFANFTYESLDDVSSNEVPHPAVSLNSIAEFNVHFNGLVSRSFVSSEYYVMLARENTPAFLYAHYPSMKYCAYLPCPCGMIRLFDDTGNLLMEEDGSKPLECVDPRDERVPSNIRSIESGELLLEVYAAYSNCALLGSAELNSFTLVTADKFLSHSLYCAATLEKDEAFEEDLFNVVTQFEDVIDTAIVALSLEAEDSAVSDRLLTIVASAQQLIESATVPANFESYVPQFSFEYYENELSKMISSDNGEIKGSLGKLLQDFKDAKNKQDLIDSIKEASEQEIEAIVLTSGSITAYLQESFGGIMESFISHSKTSADIQQVELLSLVNEVQDMYDSLSDSFLRLQDANGKFRHFSSLLVNNTEDLIEARRGFGKAQAERDAAQAIVNGINSGLQTLSMVAMTGGIFMGGRRRMMTEQMETNQEQLFAFDQNIRTSMHMSGAARSRRRLSSSEHNLIRRGLFTFPQIPRFISSTGSYLSASISSAGAAVYNKADAFVRSGASFTFQLPMNLGGYVYTTFIPSEDVRQFRNLVGEEFLNEQRKRFNKRIADAFTEANPSAEQRAARGYFMGKGRDAIQAGIRGFIFGEPEVTKAAKPGLKQRFKKGASKLRNVFRFKRRNTCPVPNGNARRLYTNEEQALELEQKKIQYANEFFTLLEYEEISLEMTSAVFISLFDTASVIQNNTPDDDASWCYRELVRDEFDVIIDEEYVCRERDSSLQAFKCCADLRCRKSCSNGMEYNDKCSIFASPDGGGFATCPGSKQCCVDESEQNANLRMRCESSCDGPNKRLFQSVLDLEQFSLGERRQLSAQDERLLQLLGSSSTCPRPSSTRRDRKRTSHYGRSRSIVHPPLVPLGQSGRKRGLSLTKAVGVSAVGIVLYQGGAQLMDIISSYHKANERITQIDNDFYEHKKALGESGKRISAVLEQVMQSIVNLAIKLDSVTRSAMVLDNEFVDLESDEMISSPVIWDSLYEEIRNLLQFDVQLCPTANNIDRRRLSNPQSSTSFRRSLTAKSNLKDKEEALLEADETYQQARAVTHQTCGFLDTSLKQLTLFAKSVHQGIMDIIEIERRKSLVQNQQQLHKLRTTADVGRLNTVYASGNEVLNLFDKYSDFSNSAQKNYLNDIAAFTQQTLIQEQTLATVQHSNNVLMQYCSAINYINPSEGEEPCADAFVQLFDIDVERALSKRIETINGIQTREFKRYLSQVESDKTNTEYHLLEVTDKIDFESFRKSGYSSLTFTVDGPGPTLRLRNITELSEGVLPISVEQDDTSGFCFQDNIEMYSGGLVFVNERNEFIGKQQRPLSSFDTVAMYSTLSAPFFKTVGETKFAYSLADVGFRFSYSIKAADSDNCNDGTGAMYEDICAKQTVHEINSKYFTLPSPYATWNVRIDQGQEQMAEATRVFILASMYFQSSHPGYLSYFECVDRFDQVVDPPRDFPSLLVGGALGALVVVFALGGMAKAFFSKEDEAPLLGEKKHDTAVLATELSDTSL